MQDSNNPIKNYLNKRIDINKIVIDDQDMIKLSVKNHL